MRLVLLTVSAEIVLVFERLLMSGACFAYDFLPL